MDHCPENHLVSYLFMELRISSELHDGQGQGLKVRFRKWRETYPDVLIGGEKPLKLRSNECDDIPQHYKSVFVPHPSRQEADEKAFKRTRDQDHSTVKSEYEPSTS